MNDKFTKEYLLTKIQIIKNNEYRISDGLLCPHIRASYMKKMQDSSSLQSKSPTFEALVDNVLEYTTKSNFNRFPHDCLAIHLRLGDFVALKNKSDFLDILKSVNETVDTNPGIRSIAIVCALNFASEPPFKCDVKKIMLSIDILREFIQGLPLPVQLQSSTPDEDFCKLATAQYLLTSFGGYGELAKRVKDALPKSENILTTRQPGLNSKIDRTMLSSGGA